MGIPYYLELYATGELKEKAAKAYEMMKGCRVCPRRCPVDRTNDEQGFCKIGSKARVSGSGPHFGEERPLVGRSGSGTIFFSGCNLGCRYCQNWDISQQPVGLLKEPEDLAKRMLKLQKMWCHNINLVSPTHVVPQILEALIIACKKGLKIPLVYNTGGYDSLESLRLLDGVIDIYMPDMKYSDPKVGDRLSMVENYPLINFAAVKEMHKQVGDLQIDDMGVATRGLIVRHLVLPNNLAGTRRIMRFLADNISKNTYLNVMDQYHPEYRAMECEGMGRRPTRREIEQAYTMARGVGLERLDRPLITYL
jgi:putative pyruvate formate lyase activating enzyme